MSDKASLSAIRRSIRSDLNAAGVDASTSFDCLVAVTEACGNALEHGRPTGDEDDPRVAWAIAGDEASFFIEDFSFREWSKAAHPSRRSPVEPTDRGFGFELMRGLMDEVLVDSGETGTLITLVKSFEGRN